MPSEVIFGNVCILLFADHDTTGAALVYALWVVAKNPTLQKKLQDGLGPLLEDSLSIDHSSSSFPTNHHIRQLAYLNSVIMETMRMHPTVCVGRSILADIPLQPAVDGRPAIIIPGGTDLYLIPLMLRHIIQPSVRSRNNLHPNGLFKLHRHHNPWSMTVTLPKMLLLLLLVLLVLLPVARII
jgi:hypothetical protein